MSFDWPSAIHARQEATFIYDGLPRLVQPATYGVSTAGRVSLRACLIGGRSRRNSVPYWELYSVEKIARPALNGTTFESFALPGYRRGDPAFISITAQH